VQANGEIFINLKYSDIENPKLGSINVFFGLNWSSVFDTVEKLLLWDSCRAQIGQGIKSFI